MFKKKTNVQSHGISTSQAYPRTGKSTLLSTLQVYPGSGKSTLLSMLQDNLVYPDGTGKSAQLSIMYPGTLKRKSTMLWTVCPGIGKSTQVFY